MRSGSWYFWHFGLEFSVLDILWSLWQISLPTNRPCWHQTIKSTSESNQLKSQIKLLILALLKYKILVKSPYVKLWLCFGFNSNISLESLWGHLKLGPNFEIRSKTWLAVRFMYWLSKWRRIATHLIIFQLEVYGPSGPRLLAGGPSGLMTSSFAPFGRSGRVTHAKETWHG